MLLKSDGLLTTCAGKSRSCRKFWCQYEVLEVITSTSAEVGSWKLHYFWYEKDCGFGGFLQWHSNLTREASF